MAMIRRTRFACNGGEPAARTVADGRGRVVLGAPVDGWRSRFPVTHGGTFESIKARPHANQKALVRNVVIFRIGQVAVPTFHARGRKPSFTVAAFLGGLLRFPVVSFADVENNRCSSPRVSRR